MGTIIITVDLGHFKAYRVSQTSLGKSKTQLVKCYDSIEAHGKLLDKITDQAGRFKLSCTKGGGGKAKGYGEPHNMKLEAEKRLIKLIAQNIATILEREKSEEWYFAASEELNSRILASLSPDLKDRLKQNVEADLTKSPKADILRHFGIG